MYNFGITGLPPLLLAFLFWLTMPDNPGQIKMLSGQEKHWLLRKLQNSAKPQE